MGKKRTKVIGGEEFGELSIEELVHGPKKRPEKAVARQSTRERTETLGRVKEEAEAERQVTEALPVMATKKEVKAVVARRKRIKRRRGRSAAYQQALGQVNRQRVYKLIEAIGLLKKISYTKFDPTVELHVHTVSKKGQEPIRFTLTLPAGAVKQPRVRIIDELALQDIEAGKIDFDVAIAEPAMMAKLAKYAKVLGPRGLMPNPKAGTVTDDPQKVMEQFQKGQIEVRSDSLGNTHVGLAKLSWEIDRIVENVKAILSHIPVNRIGSVTLTATMSPGLKVAL